MGEIIKAIKAKKTLLAFIILTVVGLAIYANSFHNQLFWDDDDVITNNVFIKDWRYWPKFFSQSLIAGVGQVSNYWRPLLLVSFSLDYHFWGLNPIGYHLINTILHLLTAGLAFWLILKISHKHWLSFLTALFFLTHPLNTEAVTYVAGRADPLSAVLMLLALIFYLDFRQQAYFWHSEVKAEATEAELDWRKLIFSLVFFMAALLVKEQAIFLPAILILIELILIKRRQENFYKKVLPLAPYFVLAAVYLILHLTLFNFNNLLQGFNYDYSQDYNTNPLIRLWTFFKVMLDYWRLLFWPIGLHMAREVAPVTQVFSWPVALFLSTNVGLVVLAVKTWRQDKLIAFGLLWYFLLLLPRANLLKINHPMYEHWLYLPMIGFWLALFSLAALAVENGSLKKIKKSALVAAVLFAVALSFLTVKRNQDWRDPITFYEKNLRYTPNSFIQRNNLGMAYAAIGKNQAAISQYRQAIASKDVYAQVHYNLANALAATGDFEIAIGEYKKAIIMSPTFSFPYQNLLFIYINRQDRVGTDTLLIEMKKNLDERIYFKYAGLAEFYFKDYQLALTRWRQLLDLEPNNLEIKGFINLAKEAMSQIEKK